MVRLFFSNSNNFGDAINPYLFECITGKKAVHSKRYFAKFSGVGSILHNFTKAKTLESLYNYIAPEIAVWGSGFIAEAKSEKESFHNRKIKFLALRGELSKIRVEKIIDEKLDIPLGDPGLLFSRMIEKKITKKYSVAIVPHTADMDNVIFQELAENIPYSKIVSLRGNPIDVLHELASADFILSTAMHGLIAGDSLGIPNKWLEVSDKVIGNGYKFRDYYSVFGIKDASALRIDKANITPKDINDFALSYNIKQEKVKHIAENLSNVLKNYASNI